LSYYKDPNDISGQKAYVPRTYVRRLSLSN